MSDTTGANNDVRCGVSNSLQSSKYKGVFQGQLAITTERTRQAGAHLGYPPKGISHWASRM